MKIGDKIIHDDFPGAVATIKTFEMRKVMVDKKKLGKKKEEIRTTYTAVFDGTGVEFKFYGFDIGRRIHLVEPTDEYHQMSIEEIFMA